MSGLNQEHDLTVSIVAYKTNPSELGQAIRSVRSSGLRLEVIVVDNSPSSELESYCRNMNSRYIFVGRNVGFGSGHNIAFRNAPQTPFHLVLNPDVQFSDNVLQELLAFMQLNESVGLVMPRVVYPDGSPQDLCKKLPTPVDIILRRFLPKALKWVFKRRLVDFELQDLDRSQILSVPYLSGCFMLMRRSAIEETGGFDERFFMYFEDLDLTRQIHRHHHTVYYPDVSILHRHEKGSYKSLRLLYWGLSSAVLYFNKWGWCIDRERNRLNRAIGPLHGLTIPEHDLTCNH